MLIALSNLKQLLAYPIFIFFFGISVALQGQNEQLRAFTLEDGLPQSQVFDMVQDAKGYLWLGTQGGGLARFDGSEFKVFNTSNGLNSNYIHALKAMNDTLYVGTKRGLSVLLKTNFVSSPMPQINSFKSFGNKVYALTARGLYEISANLKPIKIKLTAALDQAHLNDLVFDGKQYWLASKSGLFKLSNLSEKTRTIKKMESNNFVALVFYEDNIFAATFNDGTFIFNPNHFEDALLMREPLRINTMSIQNSNALWVTTDSDGISIIDTETFRTTSTISTTNGLSVPHVRMVLKDQQSNLWIATSGGGFYKYFQNNFKHYDTSTGLKGNRIYAVHSTNDGLWLSNSEQGLSKIDPLGVHTILPPENFSEVKIKTLASDHNGNIWSGSDGRGLWFRETKTRDTILRDNSIIDELKQVTIPLKTVTDYVLNTETGFPYDWIRSLQIEKDTIWAATYSSGIVKFSFDSKTENFKIYKVFASAEGIADLYIMQIVPHKDQIWYATQNGHLGFIKNGKVTHLGLVLDQDVAINSMLFQNNTLYLGTAGKGIWWAELGDQLNFKKLKGAKPLSSDNCFQLIFDDQGYLWAGAERGVDKIELNPEHEITEVYHFSRDDGFLGMETCLNAVDKDARGHLWFGAIYGLTEFQPNEQTSISQKPKVFFDDVKVAYQSVDSINLQDWTNSAKVLKLQPDQTQVSFSYKSIDLNHPNDIEYRSKLNETEWSPWSKENTQNFSGLAYGSYEFTVVSRNSRWEESTPKRFSFYIDSPWYQKTIVQWAGAALILNILGILIWSYIRRLKRKNKAAQERLKLENHLLGLEQKALRLQMNPHFMFNVLNGIKAMAKTKPDKMNATIQSFATLLRETLINSRKELISLEEEMSSLQHYIEVEQLMAQKPFAFEMHLDSDYEAEAIQIPPMLIQPFVENAIRHGISKVEALGQLKLNFKTTEDLLYVTISDNGIGIYEAQKQKQKTDHQSMALKVTEERLASISGKNALQITELKNNDGSIKGTQIVLKIPLETDY